MIDNAAAIIWEAGADGQCLYLDPQTAVHMEASQLRMSDWMR